jgi:hypothetical protein
MVSIMGRPYRAVSYLMYFLRSILPKWDSTSKGHFISERAEKDHQKAVVIGFQVENNATFERIGHSN